MAQLVLPLTNDGELEVTTDIGVVLKVRSYYNPSAPGWYVDLYDESEELLVAGVALVTGIDLLRQFPTLDMGPLVLAVTGGGDGQGPEDLGTVAQLMAVV